MTSRGPALALAALMLLAPPASATWSIILVDTATGEVGVAAATCLAGVDLLKLLPVVVVGKGGGAAQSAVDTTAKNRKEIFENLKLGTPPEEIIVILIDGDILWKSRQYGIADFSPAAAGFTGDFAQVYKEDVHGTVGTLTYAIQGNVLTGAPVIDAAEAAVLGTSGSLADRLLAGMEAARAMGGDGRCSCSPSAPTSCGSPPPSFTKSADVGFMVVARMGDVDGVCSALNGCASGTYWLKLNVANQLSTDPDPVLQLTAQYAAFLDSLHGHPDGLRSAARFDHDVLLADGVSTRTLGIGLYDHFGDPILQGGATVSVAHAPGSAGLTTLGPVIDHGDGTYTLEVTAGTGSGTDLFEVRVDDGSKPATLYPWPALELRPALQADVAELSSAAGGVAALQLLGPSSSAGRPYVLALSGSGSVPGQLLPSGVLVPLNADRLFEATASFAGMGVLQGSRGFLDGGSEAAAALVLQPGDLAFLAGLPLTLAWVTTRPLDFASNAVTVDILP